MTSIKILWVDDEIELLKSHFLFLKQRGYDTTPCNNGQDALHLIKSSSFDVVLLDESMPGLNGFDTLSELKIILPNLPIIMITKNDEEKIMEEAIGAKISDYLIKPVNPHQILLALKKLFQYKDLIAEKTTSNYQKEFRKISLELIEIKTAEDWTAFYVRMIYWEMELQTLDDTGMLEIFEEQMKEANHLFSKFVMQNYKSWIMNENGPTLSHKLFKERLFPEIIPGKKDTTLLLVIDNLRYDQWKMIAPVIKNHYKTKEESTYFSLLPTATHYCRNSLFSGLTPLEMKDIHPDLWVNENEEGGKNLKESEFLKAQLARLNKDINYSYVKITNLKSGKEFHKSLQNYCKDRLLVVVYNFVDMISHAKTEMEIIKELAADNKAYRSLTLSWFENSPLLDIIQKAQKLGFKLAITTDHGTINVDQAIEIISTKDAGSNLRYKTGRNISQKSKDVTEFLNPKEYMLPAEHLNGKFVFAKGSQYFIFQNNFNHFAAHFKNTFQHGGISMEEMIVPFVLMTPRES